MSDPLLKLLESGRDLLPLGKWVNVGVKYLLDNSAAAFDWLGHVVEAFAQSIEAGLIATPPTLMIVAAIAQIADDRLRHVVDRFADRQMLTVAQAQPLGPDARRDDRQSRRQRFENLQARTAANAERNDHHGTARKERPHIGDIGVQLDAGK